MSGAEGGEEVTHRGIRWRRARGRLAWWDEDGQRWVQWRPGRDAPPRPPDWDVRSSAGPGGRPRWRSPYRLVPVILVVAAVVIALIQVFHPSTSAVKAEAAAAAKLNGQCLHSDGTFNGLPRYSATPVACDSAQATVKVVAVVATGPGEPGTCPAGSSGLQLGYAGVAHPHLICLRPQHASGG